MNDRDDDDAREKERAESARRTVLARRARFVAAAVASVGIACGKSTSNDAPPGPCLSVAIDRDAGPVPPPQPCLKPMPRAEEDAGGAPATDSGATSTSRDASVGVRSNPQPCLSIVANQPDEQILKLLGSMEGGTGALGDVLKDAGPGSGLDGQKPKGKP